MKPYVVVIKLKDYSRVDEVLDLIERVGVGERVSTDRPDGEVVPIIIEPGNADVRIIGQAIPTYKEPGEFTYIIHPRINIIE